MAVTANEDPVLYVELTPAMLRALYLGPWFAGDMGPTTESVRIFVEPDSDSVYVEYAFGEEWSDPGSGIVLDKGGALYASGPFRKNRDEDTCVTEIIAQSEEFVELRVTHRA